MLLIFGFLQHTNMLLLGLIPPLLTELPTKIPTVPPHPNFLILLAIHQIGQDLLPQQSIIEIVRHNPMQDLLQYKLVTDHVVLFAACVVVVL